MGRQRELSSLLIFALKNSGEEADNWLLNMDARAPKQLIWT